MRKTLSYVCMAFAAMLFISCDPEDPQKGPDDGPDDPQEPVIENETKFILDESTPETIEVDWRADTVIIRYSIENPVEENVQASSNASWLTFFTQMYGEISVYVSENMEFEDRSAEITLSYAGIEYTIPVVQASRIWDQEVICQYYQGYYYGEKNSPDTGIHSAQFYISDTGWGDTGYTQDPAGHYFQINVYFPEQPEGTDMVPEGTYELQTDGGYSEWCIYHFGSSYFPGTMAVERKLFTEGKLTVTKDGDNYIIDLDVVTEEDNLSRHARYTGPMSLRIM